MKIEFSTDNAAFHAHSDDNEWMDKFFTAREVDCIFKEISNAIRCGARSAAILDSNGNKIGSWEL